MHGPRVALCLEILTFANSGHALLVFPDFAYLGSCKTSTSFIPKFWQDMSPTVVAIITMDKAKCNDDDDGTAAVQATTAKNNHAFQAQVREFFSGLDSSFN